MVKKKVLVIDYNQIDKNIFIGSNSCCQIHFDRRLLKAGIRADISLEKKRLDVPLGVNYYLWLPVIDHTAPTVKQLYVGAKAIECLVMNNEKIYVHCKNGHGRAPTLVAAYYILNGMTTSYAISLIKKKRKVIHLNKKQVNALRKFEKLIR